MIGIKRYFFLVLIVVASACQQQKETRTIPVEDFFKSQNKVSYRLSPDGKKLSYLKLQGADRNIYIEDVETGEGKSITHFKGMNIIFYFWVSSNELVYYKEVDAGNNQSDMYIVDKDGKNERQLVNNEKSRLRIIEDQLIDDKYLLLASNKRDSTVFDVYRLNVRDGSMEMAAKNPGNIIDWRTDSEGKLRLAVSSDGVNSTILYREKESQPFKRVLTSNFKDTFTPVAFNHQQPNIIYAISDINRDKTALVEVDCKTGKELRNLFCNDTLNITEALYSRKTQKVSFVVYETWKKEKYFLDDSVRQVYANLDKLLPKTETRIYDKDEAENVFLLRTFTDKNPGSYYLYFANKGKIRKLSDFNASIKENEMCEMKQVSYHARDGLLIHAYLTLPLNMQAQNLPVVVLPHDGPGQRTLWGYNPEVQFLANRGYAVFQVNYRGSSGYGKTFAAAGFKQWGGKIQDDIDDGVKWLVDRKIADPKRIGLYGTGFGGYIALNGLYLNPKAYACAVSNSGVINLFSYLKSIPPYQKPILQMYYEVIGNPLTDIDKMRQVSPLFQTDKINAPVLLAQNIKDPTTNAGETTQFVKNLKKRNVTVSYIQNNGDIFIGKNEALRHKFYNTLDEFLEFNLKRR